MQPFGAKTLPTHLVAVAPKEPKVVIALGSCSLSTGIFQKAYNVCGPVDKIIPVDVYVPGCPPKPEAIIDGIVKGIGILTKK